MAFEALWAFEDLIIFRCLALACQEIAVLHAP